MIPEFDEFPVFYFSNHNAMFGDGQPEIKLMSDHFEQLDFELKLRNCRKKRGKNILAKERKLYWRILYLK